MSNKQIETLTYKGLDDKLIYIPNDEKQKYPFLLVKYWDISNLNPVGRSSEDNKDDKVEGHGTQKPIECMARPIRNNIDIK